LDPDGMIASRNVERFRQTGLIDARYLQTLSLDAVPALAGLPDPERDRVLAGYTGPDPDGWPAWNVGRERARRLLGAEPSHPG
ncbi:MAG TPA: DUF4153 domain-containing protein, partial [Actinomycetota bacterium]|nr:DUF4153 domain-containing protein [Actinomycetota bacterium]